MASFVLPPNAYRKKHAPAKLSVIVLLINEDTDLVFEMPATPDFYEVVQALCIKNIRGEFKRKTAAEEFDEALRRAKDGVSEDEFKQIVERHTHSCGHPWHDGDTPCHCENDE